MRVLLDEQLPRHLAWQLVGQDVRTVHEQDWAGLKNRELLSRALAAGFEAFLTTDRDFAFHEDLVHSGLRVVLLHDLSVALEDLLPLVPEVLSAIETTGPGRVVRVPNRELGVVATFSDRDQRGEITSDETGERLFLNATQIRGLPTLAAGDRVEFTRVEMPEGLYASDVVRLSDPSG
jgi:cold shock CspA family protein/predicted nuclease of predicted toxin-antitoxin system